MRYTARSKLTNSQRSLLRLSYNVIRNPKKIRGHLNRFQYDRSVLKKPEIDFVPPNFLATITNNCNLRCPSCLYLLEDPGKFTPKYITPDDFRRILEKYNKGNKIRIIYLSGGEPLLHPQIDELIDICKEYNCEIGASTNGILVKSKLSSLLKLTSINVSIDAYNYESYEKYRGGTTKQFDLIIEGLKILKKKRCHFGISYLLSLENIAEVDKMVKLAEEIGPEYVYFHNINPHGCEQYKPLTIRDRNTKMFLEKILRRSDYPFDINVPVMFDQESTSFLTARCVAPWSSFCFDSVGDVSYCCHLSHDAHIGNVFSDYNFNSSRMLQFRKDIIKGKIPKSCLYCQRRFEDGFGNFDSKIGKWFINNRTFYDLIKCKNY